MGPYATVEDFTTLIRSPDGAAEEARIKALLPVLSDMIRAEAEKYHMDYDLYLSKHPAMVSVAKATLVGVCSRVINADTKREAFSQESQGANGYTWSGTYALPGGGIVSGFMEKDWKALGIHRRRRGTVSMI